MAVLASLDRALARLDRLSAACRALPKKIAEKDRETVRALRREIDALPSADRAALAEEVYLDEAEASLAVIDRTHTLTVIFGTLAVCGVSLLILRIVLRRRRAAAAEREVEE